MSQEMKNSRQINILLANGAYAWVDVLEIFNGEYYFCLKDNNTHMVVTRSLGCFREVTIHSLYTIIKQLHNEISTEKTTQTFTTYGGSNG